MDELEEPAISTVTTTVGSAEAARELARRIVEARLAACVQLEPITASVYRWEGAICEEPEVRLTMKTPAAKLQQLSAFIAEHHPYALPQFTAWATSCSPAYAQWVRDCTGDGPAG